MSEGVHGIISPLTIWEGAQQKSSELQNKAMKQIEDVYARARVLHKICATVYKQPGRVGCATVCLGVGVSEIVSGNYFAGAMAAGAALVELAHLWKTDAPSDLKKAFDELHVDVDVIKRLQEASGASYTIIDEQLQAADREIQQILAQIQKVKDLHGEGLSCLEERKQEVLRLHSEALQRYTEAQRFLQEVKEGLTKSQAQYGDCQIAVREIQAKVLHFQNTGEDISGELLQIVTRASSSCEEGRACMDAASQKITQALKCLQNAQELKIQAQSASSSLIEDTASSLRELVEKDKTIAACKEALDSAQGELKKVRKRHSQIMEFIGTLKSDLETAYDLARSRWTNAEMFAGVAATSCAAVLTGPASAAIIGGTAAYATHYGNDLTSLASRVYRWSCGVPKDLPVALRSEERIRPVFSKISSGYWGRFVEQRASATVGLVHIALGAVGGYTLPFNLNEKDPISNLDLLRFLEKMSQLVAEKRLEPKRCLEILEQLETCTIDRGKNHVKTEGLIQKKSKVRVVIDMLKKECS